MRKGRQAPMGQQALMALMAPMGRGALQVRLAHLVRQARLVLRVLTGWMAPMAPRVKMLQRLRLRR